MLCVTALVTGGAHFLRGQSALDGFDPNANGIVYAVVLQPDGKILIGGDFTTLSPPGGATVTRNYIARLYADGTVDPDFNPDSGGGSQPFVRAIALQPDGKILVGGQFTNIGGQTRNHIARLDAVTGAADSFNPNANSSVTEIAVQADGKILAGGGFGSIGGQTRIRIARLDATSGLADLFRPDPNGDVEAIAVQTDGKILAGGNFSGVNSIGGQTRNRIARLDATTGAADSFDPNANNTVHAIAVQGDGKILAGGIFTTCGAQMRNSIARLDPTTGAADSFDPNADAANGVYALAVLADGKILAAGAFNTIGGLMIRGLARLNSTTGAPDNANVDVSAIFTVAVQPDGKIVIGGNFHGVGGQTRNHIARLTLTDLMPPAPTAVVSRKIHGDAGTFDIDLPLAGGGIECRSGGANNNYQIVFTFPSAVTFTGAAVTAGMGSVSSSGGNGTTTITVDLTGVTNAQRITVMLQGASDGTNTGDLSVPMGVLLGDVNANSSVNSTDISQTKLQSGQPVTAANFREDVNANGSINATDVSSVKLKSGTSLLP